VLPCWLLASVSLPGLVLEGFTGIAGLLDVAGIKVSRRCSAKGAKHEAIRVLASSKSGRLLRTVTFLTMSTSLCGEKGSPHLPAFSYHTLMTRLDP